MPYAWTTSRPPSSPPFPNPDQGRGATSVARLASAKSETKQGSAASLELHLWPHQSLPVEGYTRFLTVTAVLISLPLLLFLGSIVLWVFLPFLMLTLWGMKWALDRNRRDAQVLEILTIDAKNVRLDRQNARGSPQSWQCNRYWTKVTLHPVRGPVPSYVTLRGEGREVEIGSFLSEDERKALFKDLSDAIVIA